MNNSLAIIIFSSLVVIVISLGLIERFSEVSPRKLFFGIFYLTTSLLIGSLLSVPISKLPQPYGAWLPLVTTVLVVVVLSTVFWRKHEYTDKWVTDVIKSFNLLRMLGLAGPNYCSEVVVDTSVLIDARVAEIVHTGFMPYKLILPRFVLAELQNIADSTDSDRRAKGRRGLDVVEKIRKEKEVRLDITGEDFPQIDAVDRKLVAVAKKHHAALLTTDYNLNKLAKAEGVKVLNINELSQSLRPEILPGEEMEVKVVHLGKEKSQGVGYLPDGTMIVVEKGNNLLEKNIKVKITRSLQTAAGKMYFAKIIKQ